MTRQIFVNLPVKDLKKSMEFWKKLGFDFNMQFTNDDAACLVIREGSIYSMLITHPLFKTFTHLPIADAAKATQALIAIDVESRAAVDDMVKKALEAGATRYRDKTDYGWMYYDCFADLDGHQWEVMFIDESKAPGQSSAAG